MGREGIVRWVCVCACAHVRVLEPEPLSIKPYRQNGTVLELFLSSLRQELETVWAIQAELFHLV